MLQLTLKELLINRKRLYTYWSALPKNHSLKSTPSFWSTLQYELAQQGLIINPGMEIILLEAALERDSFEIICVEFKQYFYPSKALSHIHEKSKPKGKGPKYAHPTELAPDNYQYLVAFVSSLPIDIKFEPHSELLPIAPIPDIRGLEEYIGQILLTLNSLENLLIDSQAHIWLTVFHANHKTVTTIYQSDSYENIFPQYFLEKAQQFGWYIEIIRSSASDCASILAEDIRAKEPRSSPSQKVSPTNYRKRQVVPSTSLFQVIDVGQQTTFHKILKNMVRCSYPQLSSRLLIYFDEKPTPMAPCLQNLLKNPSQYGDGLYVYHKNGIENKKYSMLFAVINGNIKHFHFFALEGEWTIKNFPYHLKRLSLAMAKINHFYWHASFLSTSGASDYWHNELRDVLEQINTSFTLNYSPQNRRCAKG